MDKVGIAGDAVIEPAGPTDRPEDIQVTARADLRTADGKQVEASVIRMPTYPGQIKDVALDIHAPHPILRIAKATLPMIPLGARVETEIAGSPWRIECTLAETATDWYVMAVPA